jgi:hypothetical protein
MQASIHIFSGYLTVLMLFYACLPKLMTNLQGQFGCFLYGIMPTAYSAPRLSPVSAYGRRLLLYAAALSTPSA